MFCISVAVALYHLATPRGACILPALENRSVDLVCEQEDNHPGLGGPCQIQSMSWVRVSHPFTNGKVTFSLGSGIYVCVTSVIHRNEKSIL